MMLEIKLNKKLNKFKLVYARPSHTKDIGYSYMYTTLGNTRRAAKTLKYYLENSNNLMSLVELLSNENTFAICAPNGHVLISNNSTPRKNKNTKELLNKQFTNIKITEYSDKYETIY